MRVIICGDRNWTDEETIHEYIHTLPPNSVVIQGTCRGADMIARHLAYTHGHFIMDFPAKWDKHGRAAGPIRNKQMLTEGNPDLVIAFHDNLPESKGTADMIRQAKKAGIPVKYFKSV